MPPTRRHRPSLPMSPGGADDVSCLTLLECRDRLARNERVLNSSLFNNNVNRSTPSPSASLSTSPTSSFLVGSPPTSSIAVAAGPSRPPYDPVKEKLLLARQALLAREQELLIAESTDQVAKLEVGSPDSPRNLQQQYRRGSEGTTNGIGANRTGKARALEIIRQADASRAPNAIILPMDETFRLAERDADNATAQSLSFLSLSRPPDSHRDSQGQGQGTPTKPGRHSQTRSRVHQPIDPLDENARAEQLGRLSSFMSYKGDPDFDDDDENGDGGGNGFDFGLEFDDPDADGAAAEYPDERIGSGLVDGYEVKREKGTGEEVDEYGEDDERWLEGTDEYEGMGGVGPGAQGGLEGVR